MSTRSTLSTLAASLAMIPIVVSCASKSPLSAPQQIYAGKWVANDGSFVHIYNDGGGDLKTSNSTVTGGQTTIKSDQLKIGLGPVNHEFKITQAPQEKNGKFTMQLNGITYTKQLSDTTDSSSTANKSEKEDKLESQIKPLLEEKLGKTDSLDCPDKFEIKAGNTFNCKASIQNTPFKVKVVIKDNQGNLSWKATELLVLAKVEDSIVQAFKQRGITAQADCGSSQKKYHTAIPQETFQCKASDGKGNTTAIKVTVQNEDGTVKFTST